MAALLLTVGILLLGQVHGQCGQAARIVGQRILNGTETRACAIPWHAQLHFVDDPSQAPGNFDVRRSLACGAVIIDSEYVMISPTCLWVQATNISEVLRTMVIVAGDFDITTFPERDVLGFDQEQIRFPTDIYFQDEYLIRDQQAFVDAITPDLRVYRDHQCAIAKLNRPLDFNSCVNRICLPQPGESDCTAKNCVFSGNGLITTDIFGSDPLKNTKTEFARMTALPPPVCDVLRQQGYALDMTNGLCAKTETLGIPCVYDNGGALACNRGEAWYLRGVSVIDSCNDKGASLFSDTSKCLDFITRTVAGFGTPAV